MEEIGVVKSLSGIHATVVVQKKSVCDHCTEGTCHLTDEGAEIEAINSARAQVGQKVRVSLKAATYLKGSLIIYGFPMLALILGAVLGKEFFAPRLPGWDPEMVSALFGFGSLILSFLLVKAWSVRAEKSTEIQPVIEEILE